MAASSVIRHIHYKPDLAELSVWFAGSGRRYKFFDVPGALYQAFRDAPSRGRFFNEALRGRFRSELVSDPTGRRRYVDA